MNIRRITQVTEGWDDIYDVCDRCKERGYIKGNGVHGIHHDDVTYAVVTELPDGRQIALSTEVASNRWPVTIPKSHFGWNWEDTPARGCDLSLHVQPLAGIPAEHTTCTLIGACATGWTTALGADEFYKKHGNPESAFEQPETFWKALEDRLAASIANGDHFPQSDGMQIDHMIAAIEAKRGQAISIERVINDDGRVWAVRVGVVAVERTLLLDAVRAAFDSFVAGRPT